MPDLRQQKPDLRHIMQERRAGAQAENPGAAYALRDQFLHHVALPPHRVIASYVAHGTELCPLPLTAALHQLGHRLALPVVIGKGLPLAFRRYLPDEPLAKGLLGIMEPPAGAEEIEPDILLVPLLAFDRRLFRLGYGGGYYDRTLRLLRQKKAIMAIGLAFAAQEVPEVPTGEFDAPLDKLVTESEFLPG